MFRNEMFMILTFKTVLNEYRETKWLMSDILKVIECCF